MIILQIEHTVPDFTGWKRAFDNDPVGREKSGVKSYQICCPSGVTNYVIIDLVFDTIETAQSMLVSLQQLWGKVEGTVMSGPKTRLLDIVESKGY